MKRIQNKSFLRQILMYFGVILLIPVCAMLLLYWQTDKLVKEQTDISSRNILNQFFRAVDIALEEATKDSLAIWNSSECMEYARRAVHNEDRLSYHALVTQEKLQDYAADRYEDIFAYFPYCNKVVSGIRSSAGAEHYFKVNFDTDNAEIKQQLDAIINCENQYPRLFSITNDEGETSLCVAVRQVNRNDKRRSYTSVVILSSQYLQDLLQDAKKSLNGEFMIYGEEKELLFSTGDVSIQLPTGQDMEVIHEEKDGKTRYMIWTEESEILSGYYAYSIPYVYYWEQLSTIRMIFFWGLLSCIVLCIIIAYKLGNRAYQPVDKMINFVKGKDQEEYDRKNVSEFEYVMERMTEERKKIVQLNTQVKNNKKMVSDYFVRQLLGDHLTEHSGKELFEKNGMEIYTPYFLVAVIVAEKTEHENILHFLLQNVFCELFDEKHKGYLISLTDRRYALLVNFKNKPEETEAKEILERGRQFFWEKLGIALFIGGGSVQEGVVHITDSYKEAMETLRYRYLYGNNYVLAYEQIRKRQMRYETTTESKIMPRIISYITDCEDYESADLFIEDLFREYEIDETASIETVNFFKNIMVAVMNCVLMSRNYQMEDQTEERESGLKDVIMATTLEEFKKKLSEMLTVLYKHENEKEQNSIAVWVRNYVVEHYAEYDLNVKSISDHLGMFYGYVSRCFKDSYNVKLLDYIAQVRIQNAKSLLEESDYGMGEIAERCGFVNSDMFIKTFKKIEGITPGHYRKMIRADK